jgi:hypothetical protein
MPNSNEYDFTEECNELRENEVSFQLFIILIIFSNSYFNQTFKILIKNP